MACEGVFRTLSNICGVDLKYISVNCSKLTIEALEQSVKYVQI